MQVGERAMNDPEKVKDSASWYVELARNTFPQLRYW